MTRDILDVDGNVIGVLELPDDTSEETWAAALFLYATVPPEVTDEEHLLARIKWGKEVILQFRLYSMGLSDENGLALLSNLIDVKTTLELGMLAASAYLLASKPEDEFLDAPFSETDERSVRQRFVDLIFIEGPIP